MTDALDDASERQLAYRLLLEKTCPSFLYPVTMGATTVLERRDSMLPDRRINPCEMTSFNHYALGRWPTRCTEPSRASRRPRPATGGCWSAGALAAG